MTLSLWPGRPPGETEPLPEEADTTTPEDRLVAGKRVIRLGNVSTPTLTVYPAPPGNATGTAIVICPGGGHHILAYDLEGTEVATWLNSIGVTGIVLKYRVPARNPERRWQAAVQDAQRAMSMARENSTDWEIDPQRIGILGFSAGGQTAALSAIFSKRQYKLVDDTDRLSARPNFAALIYTGGLTAKVDEGERPSSLVEEVAVDGDTPPMFLVHAHDDPVPVENSVLLYLALRRADVPAELHVFASGGHGYGLRGTADPVTAWPNLLAAWLKTQGCLTSR